MAKDFKGLLRSLAQQLEEQEVEVIVGFAHLPDELKTQPPDVVLDRLVGDGKLSARNLKVVMDAMKEIGRNSLYLEVKEFKKKSRKMLSEDVPDSSLENYQNFDVAEKEATQLRNTLQKMEGSDAISGVNRIEEVYTEAREAAENLVRLIRRANCLSRTLRPASAARQTSEHCSSPPLTSSTECSDIPDPSPPATGGFMERLSRKMNKSTKSKTKGKQNEAATTSKDTQRILNRSLSEKGGDKVTKQSSRAPTIPLPPTPGARGAKLVHTDSDDSLDYTLPTFPVQRREPVGFVQTMPRQVPQRQQSSNSFHQPILTSTSPRNAFALPVKSRDVKAQRPPLAPTNELSDGEYEYEDVLPNFEMQNSERKSSLGHSKPQSLPQSDGHSSRNDTSSTCSTPSSDLSTPPAILPKPSSKGNISSGTPAIPIRRSSLNSKSAQSSVHSGSLQSGSDTTTPNQPMVNIQQQLKETFRLKHTASSPQGNTRVSPHPVSLAKALEMSNTQGFSPDYNDSCSCTGDSGFDEYTPLSTSWHKTAAPPTKPKPKTLKPSSPPLQSYTNITVISPTSLPHHTAISHLPPTCTPHTTTPSPPTPGHTSISAMAPMYTSMSIEEQEPETDDDEVCPDYVNVKQYAETT